MYLGNEDHIRQKINSFCDRQFDIPEVTENISKNLERQDVLKRSHISYQRVDLDDSFPQYIIDNQEKIFALNQMIVSEIYNGSGLGNQLWNIVAPRCIAEHRGFRWCEERH